MLHWSRGEDNASYPVLPSYYCFSIERETTLLLADNHSVFWDPPAISCSVAVDQDLSHFTMKYV